MMRKNVLLMLLVACLILPTQGCSIYKKVVKPVVVEQTKVQPVKVPAETVFVRVSSKPVADANFNVIYFNYDKSNLRHNQISRLLKNVDYLKKNPTMKVVVEGYCDERGTVEYNLSLGSRRANSVANFFVKKGIDKSRISVLSYGKEIPASPIHSEKGWTLNRRVEIKKF